MVRSEQQSVATQRARQAIGARLRHKRQQAGLTLRDVSALTDIHISTLSRLEAGIYTLSVHRLMTLARVLGCDQSDILCEASKLRETTHV